MCQPIFSLLLSPWPSLIVCALHKQIQTKSTNDNIQCACNSGQFKWNRINCALCLWTVVLCALIKSFSPFPPHNIYTLYPNHSLFSHFLILWVAFCMLVSYAGAFMLQPAEMCRLCCRSNSAQCIFLRINKNLDNKQIECAFFLCRTNTKFLARDFCWTNKHVVLNIEILWNHLYVTVKQFSIRLYIFGIYKFGKYTFLLLPYFIPVMYVLNIISIIGFFHTTHNDISRSDHANLFTVKLFILLEIFLLLVFLLDLIIPIVLVLCQIDFYRIFQSLDKLSVLFSIYLSLSPSLSEIMPAPWIQFIQIMNFHKI